MACCQACFSFTTWAILWPIAWLWEQIVLGINGLAEDVRAWWLITDDATFTLTPEARVRLRDILDKSKD